MSASTAQQAATAERRTRNLSMRLGGASWDMIAAQLGYAGKAAACKDFQRALAATRASMEISAAELREVELLRLDRVQAGSWTSAMKGDHKAADTVLKCHDRRVKLLDMTGAQRAMDNAVDAWIEHLRDGDLDEADQAALDAVA